MVTGLTWCCVALETENKMATGLSRHTFSSPSPRQWKAMTNRQFAPMCSPKEKSTTSQTLCLAAVGSHHCFLCRLLPRKGTKWCRTSCVPPLSSTQSHDLFFSEVRIPCFHPTAMVRMIWNNLDKFTQSKLCHLTVTV